MSSPRPVFHPAAAALALGVALATLSATLVAQTTVTSTGTGAITWNFSANQITGTTITGSPVSVNGLGMIFTGTGATITTNYSGSGILPVKVTFAATNFRLTGSQSFNLNEISVDVAGNANSSAFLGMALTNGGSFTKSGNANLVVTADSAIPAAITVGAGNLQLGEGSSGGTTGSLVSSASVAIASGATFTVNRSNAFTLGNATSGAGKAEFTGTGTTTLASNLAHGGGTNVKAGTLQIGNTSTLGALSGSIDLTGGFSLATFTERHGSLVFHRSDTVTHSGAISGGNAAYSSVTKNGANTLTLAGALSYLGPTNINLGSLTLGGASTVTLPATTALTIASGATFNASGRAQTLGGLSGAGTYTGGAGKPTVNTSADTTFSGTLTTSGGFEKAGSGTLTLSGNAAYTGATTVSGGTLAFSGSGLPNTGAGAYTVSSGATLRLTPSANLSLAPDVTGTGTWALSGPASPVRTVTHTGTANIGTLSLTGVDFFPSNAFTANALAFDSVTPGRFYRQNNNALTLAPAISGPARIRQASAGTLTFGSATLAASGATLALDVDASRAVVFNAPASGAANVNYGFANNAISVSLGSGASLTTGAAHYSLGALTGAGTLSLPANSRLALQSATQPGFAATTTGAGELRIDGGSSAARGTVIEFTQPLGHTGLTEVFDRTARFLNVNVAGPIATSNSGALAYSLGQEPLKIGLIEYQVDTPLERTLASLGGYLFGANNPPIRKLGGGTLTIPALGTGAIRIEAGTVKLTQSGSYTLTAIAGTPLGTLRLEGAPGTVVSAGGGFSVLSTKPGQLSFSDLSPYPTVVITAGNTLRFTGIPVAYFEEVTPATTPVTYENFLARGRPITNDGTLRFDAASPAVTYTPTSPPPTQPVNPLPSVVQSDATNTPEDAEEETVNININQVTSNSTGIANLDAVPASVRLGVWQRPIAGAGQLVVNGYGARVTPTGETVARPVSYIFPSTYTGGTQLNGGYTEIATPGRLDSPLGSGPVSVASAAWLGGTGVVPGAVTLAGTLAPGLATTSFTPLGAPLTDPGALTLGSVVAQPGATLAWNEGDALAVTGNFDFTALGVLNPLTVRLHRPGLVGATTPQSWTLIDAASLLNYAAGKAVPLADGFELTATGALSLGTTSLNSRQQLVLHYTPGPQASLLAWRYEYLGTTSNSGLAANDFDFDADGLPNLLEYAFATLPNDPASVTRPTLDTTTVSNESRLRLTFLRARSDLTYTVQATSDLAAGPWADLATNPGTVSPTTPVSVTDTQSATAAPGRRFLRLLITAP